MLKHLPKRNGSSRDFVYRTIKQSIIELYFHPEDKISEASIAKELNVSRTPVREALILLELEGLIYVKPKQGTFVSKIKIVDVKNFLFVRKTLEQHVLKLACQFRTDEDLQELKKELDAQKVFCQIQDAGLSIFLLDNSFHKLVYQIGNHEEAWRLLQKNGATFNRLRTLDLMDGNNTKHRIDEHCELVAIIEQKATEKVNDWVTRHLDALEHSLPRLMNSYPHYFE